MEIFLSCIFVITIIILIFRIIDFSIKLIIHNKQMSTRNYDIESVLDKYLWQALPGGVPYVYHLNNHADISSKITTVGALTKKKGDKNGSI